MGLTQEQKFLRLFLLLNDTSSNVVRGFTETKVLTSYGGNLSEFLEQNVHCIFHLWKNYTICCQCEPTTATKSRAKELNNPQFELIFNTNGTRNPDHIRKGKNPMYCLCAVSVKPDKELTDLDITLIHILLRNIATLDEEEKMWLNAIKKVRDKLAHVTSTTAFTESKLDDWWNKLEGSTRGLASKLQKSYKAHIESCIDDLKTREFSCKKVQSVLQKVKEQTGEDIECLQDQVAVLSEQVENTKEELVHGQHEIKTCISDSELILSDKIRQLDEKFEKRFLAMEKVLEQLPQEQQREVQQFQKLVLECIKEHSLENTIKQGNERCLLQLGNSLLMIQCFKQQTTAEEEFGKNEADKMGYAGAVEIAQNDTTNVSRAEVCKVEWKVVTPGNWDVDRIVTKLKQGAALLKEDNGIIIDLVRTGSLILSTTVPCYLMNDRDQFYAAVHDLFAKIVDVCTLDVDEPNLIKVFLSVRFPVSIPTKTLTIHTTVPVKIFKDRETLQAASESFLTRVFQECDVDVNQVNLIRVDMNVKDVPMAGHKITKSKSAVAIKIKRSKSAGAIAVSKSEENKEMNLKSAQSPLKPKLKETKEKRVFESGEEVPWKFRFGFKRLISLRDKDSSDIVMTFDRYKEALGKALNDKSLNKNRETLTLLLRCLSKCADCKSLVEQCKEIFSILEHSSFLQEHAVQFVENIAKSRGISKPQIEEYRNSIKDFLKILLKLRLIVPKSRIVVMGIHTVIETPINILKADTELIDDETWELFRGLEQAKQPRQSLEMVDETGTLNFRDYPPFPTTTEVQAADPPQILPNKSSGGYANLDSYLDVQYKLLREDFIAPLRESIRDYIEATNTATKLRKPYEFTMYYDVQIISPICNYHGLCRRLSFNCKDMAKIRWESTKHLIFGSLLCLSSDNFQTVWFATVTDRDLKNIQKGLVDVKFEKDHEEVSSISSDTIFVMAETTAYFEAYKHVMIGMQKMRNGDLPFEKHIVQCSQIVSEPMYIKRNPEAVYDLRPLVDETRLRDPSSNEEEQYTFSKLSAEAKTVEIMKAETWPSADLLHLDNSQLSALRSALTKEFALIQGPPGTGKTYVGVKIVKALLHNRQVWGRNPDTGVVEKTPILIICYTNHALDQFLEEVDNCYKGEVLRLGGRSSSAAMKPLSIVHKRMTMRINRKVPVEVHSSKMEIKHSVCLIMEEINSISLRVEKAKRDILHEDTLKDVMGQLYSKLKERYYDIVHGMYGQSKKKLKRKSSCAMLEWLGFGKLLGFESADDDQDTGGDNQSPDSIKSEDPLTTLGCSDDYINVLDENDADISERSCVSNDVYEDEDDGAYAQKTTKSEDVELVDENYFSVALDVSNIETFQKDDEDQITGFKKPKQKVGKWKKKIRKNLLSSDRMSVNEVENIKDVWELLPDARWRLYRYWLNLLCMELEDSIREREVEFDKTCRKYHEILMQEDKAIMKNASIIGMTTTCAARYQAVLQELKPKIIVVEEAAEVLEGHIVSSLNQDCEHLILIGDHKQLKPKPTVYKLAQDYDLNLSLFERMANNNVELECLTVQHRMNPSISEIMQIIYPNLEDHEMVKHLDTIKGVASNVFFIDHSQPESYEKDLRSRSNRYEADYLVRLCKYFLQQGYDPSEITVLTTYSGQLFELKYRMPKSEFDGVRVTVVDNYQGEENDIVLLSLVRSNDDGDIGFLKEDNRTCVALSRARKGLFVIGNFSMLSRKNDLWAKIVDHAVKNNLFGTQLRLVCPNHQESIAFVEQPSDFDNLGNTLCKQNCGFQMPCGHTCPKRCHLKDSEHKNVTCNKPCTKSCTMGHRCKLKCRDQCRKCDELIEKICPKCGHQQKLPCYLNSKEPPGKQPCKQLLKAVGLCGHPIIKVSLLFARDQ